MKIVDSFFFFFFLEGGGGMDVRLYIPILSDADVEVKIFCIPSVRDCPFNVRSLQLLEVALAVLYTCFVRHYPH